MTRHHLTAAALLAALSASNSIGQTTVPGDVVIAPGGTLIINDDTTYTGTLTIGAGAQVVVDTGYQINIADGATITINGTDAEPVVLFPINGSWDGLKLLDGSTADLNYALISDVLAIGIEADDADVSLVGCEVFDSAGFSVTHGARRYPIVARNGTDLDVDQCVIGPFRGRNGSNGGNGGTGGAGGAGSSAQGVTGIDAQNVDRLHVTNSRFYQLQGGDGGRGGNGGNGSNGGTGSDAGVGGSPGTGGGGGTGGRGGHAGNGGSTIVIYADTSADTLIAQNLVLYPAGGRGGMGGTGGRGGNGGRGGKGAPGVFGNGGTGGRGGNGGKGGNGGNGGTTGSVQLFRVIDPGSAAVIANNTVYEATAQTGGVRGNPGGGGSPGAGGPGGSAGIGGSTGSTGPSGSGGSSGSYGSTGAHGNANAVITTGSDLSGFGAIASNNLMTFTGSGNKLPFLSTDTGIIDATTNLASGFDSLSSGPIVGGLTVITDAPVFVDAGAGDFTLAKLSPGVDAGDNALVPTGIDTDFLGNARFADDTGTPDTGMGDSYIVDMGAIERPGETNECLADTNGDGIVSPADFSAWVAAFNTQAAGCDQNGDGVCSPADFSAWVSNYNAGCD